MPVLTECLLQLRSAILSFNKQQAIARRSTLKNCPAGKEQIIFIENHDLDRMASIDESEKQRWLPHCVYWGVPSFIMAEIGMKTPSANNIK
jgi:hypothetical protein